MPNARKAAVFFYDSWLLMFENYRLPKAAGAEVAVQPRNEKWHAAVARSAFVSQNAQNTA